MAPARVVSAGLLLAAVATGMRRHRTGSESFTEVAEVAAPVSNCNAPNVVYRAVRRIANSIIDSKVAPLDPLHLDFPDVEAELNLIACNVGVKLDMNLNLSGFAATEVGPISCGESVCLEEGLFGRCNKQLYEFNIDVDFGEVIAMHGWTVADWKLCWREANDRRVEVGVDIVGPAVSSKFKVEYTRGRFFGLFGKAKIVEVVDLGLDMGTPDNFACGFKSLPNFIGSRLERWCTRIGGWLLEKTYDNINTRVNNALTNLVNKVFDVEPEPER